MSMAYQWSAITLGLWQKLLGDPRLLASRGNSDALAEIIVELLDDKERRRQIGSRNRETSS